jgi:DNA repair exonuclease SbcCD ATPase subunit
MTDEYTVQDRKETPGWMVAAILLLAIVSIAGFGLAWRGQTRLEQMSQDYTAQLKTTQQEHTQYTESVNSLGQQLAKADEQATALRSDVDLVTRRLRVTQSDLNKARTEAAQIREESSKQLEEMGTAVNTELATKATSEQLNTVTGDVTVVKTDLESTKNDLRMTRSELGTLIARNGEEIGVLRRMGERDYVEFTIQGKKKPQVVGPVTVELRSVDTKRNKFTVALVVDDMRTEKKDRLVNEPIFFYPRGAKTQATEFVVNSVGKDKITGYVSVPKRTPAGSTTAASAGN